MTTDNTSDANRTQPTTPQKPTKATVEPIDYEAIARVCIPVLVDDKGTKYIQFSYGRKYGDLSYNYLELKDIVERLVNSPLFSEVARKDGK